MGRASTSKNLILGPTGSSVDPVHTHRIITNNIMLKKVIGSAFSTLNKGEMKQFDQIS